MRPRPSTEKDVTRGGGLGRRRRFRAGEARRKKGEADQSSLAHRDPLGERTRSWGGTMRSAPPAAPTSTGTSQGRSRMGAQGRLVVKVRCFGRSQGQAPPDGMPSASAQVVRATACRADTSSRGTAAASVPTSHRRQCACNRCGNSAPAPSPGYERRAVPQVHLFRMSARSGCDGLVRVQRCHPGRSVDLRDPAFCRLWHLPRQLSSCRPSPRERGGHA